MTSHGARQAVELAAQRGDATLPADARDRLEIRIDPRKGRGLYATHRIMAGELIEAAPVIVVPSDECPLLDRTTLAHYYFHWDGDAEGDGRGAIALGHVTLCNHSARPRARVSRNYARQTLDLVAATTIEPGDEITIDYGCPLWFEVSE
jgi:uncharacterized protein